MSEWHVCVRFVKKKKWRSSRGKKCRESTFRSTKFLWDLHISISTYRYRTYCNAQCVYVYGDICLHHFQRGKMMLPSSLPLSTLITVVHFFFCPLLSAPFSVLPGSPRHPWWLFTALMGHWVRGGGRRVGHLEEEKEDWGFNHVAKKRGWSILESHGQGSMLGSQQVI